jgi:hypothetical protein
LSPEHDKRGGGWAAGVLTALGLVGAVLVVAAFIFGLAIRPPVLGWLGYAIVSIVALGLAALVPIAFERTRVNPPRPAAAVDHERRLLVVADSQCSETALRAEILAHLDGAGAVHLVIPVRVSHLHFLTDDEGAEERESQQSMRLTTGLLQQSGVSATGTVGSDKPLESMADALGSFPATQVLLATPPEDEAYWLERDLLAKARLLTKVPVTQVIVPSMIPVGGGGGESRRVKG